MSYIGCISLSLIPNLVEIVVDYVSLVELSGGIINRFS